MIDDVSGVNLLALAVCRILVEKRKSSAGFRGDPFGDPALTGAAKLGFGIISDP